MRLMRHLIGHWYFERLFFNACQQLEENKTKQNKTKNPKLILSVFAYAKFGIAIFITFRLSNIANAIEAIENATADIKIILNEVADGK